MSGFSAETWPEDAGPDHDGAPVGVFLTTGDAERFVQQVIESAAGSARQGRCIVRACDTDEVVGEWDWTGRSLR